MALKINIESPFKQIEAKVMHLMSLGVLACALALASASSSAASFDCTKANSAVEHAICSDGELSKLDGDMAASYRAVKAAYPEALSTQRDWLRYRRNKCATRECLVAAYRERINQFRNGSWADVSLSAAPSSVLESVHGDVVYATPEHKDAASMLAWLKQSQILESTFNRARPYYRFPSSLRIFVMDCNEANAYYYDSKAAVVVCYQLISNLIGRARTLQKEHPEFPVTRQLKILENSLAYVLLHELGHAALHNKDSAPGLGPEEFKADTFASVLLLEFQRTTDARLDALWGVRSFAEIIRNDPNDIRSYSDEHGLSSQRYVGFVCLAIGSDSRLGPALVASNIITERRANGCPNEWKNRRIAVLRLPHPS